MKKYLIGCLLIALFSVTKSQTIISLSDYEGHSKLKKIAVKIEGVNYNFLFDTGAGVTLISPEVAKKINRREYGRSVGYRMLGEKVEYAKCDSVEVLIGDYKFFHSTVGVWDLNQVLPKGWPKIDGVISLGSFQGQCVTLDLSANTITVESDSTCRTKTNSMQLVESRFVNGFTGLETGIFLNLDQVGRKWWFLMDSGNLDKNKISHTTAKEWNIKSTADSGRVDMGNVNYKLAGISKDLPTVADEIIYDGVLNFDFLSQIIITLSFAEEKVWIK
ncbi:MAG: hypothetical protein CL840_21740 [Crocinitomicaceae bacterium]|nr:hypothetical protein [Crocinitomicaceae bacterium]|tara:strand:+ start:9402 stop:10226 length:825 start_codon:yes stop_codon:yes gene_type:complete